MRFMQGMHELVLSICSSATRLSCTCKFGALSPRRGVPSSANVFRDLDDRSLTKEEEDIIAARVAAQRKMAEEYDKRERARKARQRGPAVISNFWSLRKRRWGSHLLTRLSQRCTQIAEIREMHADVTEEVAVLALADNNNRCARAAPLRWRWRASSSPMTGICPRSEEEACVALADSAYQVRLKAAAGRKVAVGVLTLARPALNVAMHKVHN